MTLNVLTILAIIAGLLAILEMVRGAVSMTIIAVLLLAIGIVVQFGIVK